MQDVETVLRGKVRRGGKIGDVGWRKTYCVVLFDGEFEVYCPGAGGCYAELGGGKEGWSVLFTITMVRRDC